MSARAALTAADELDPPPQPPHPHLHDPVGWVTTRTGGHLWSLQRRIMDSVRDHRRTAVPASHGPGKSHTAGRLVGWWIDIHPPGTAFVVTTAPTDTQVKAILWEEIKRTHRRGDLAGQVLENATWKIGGSLVAIGRKPADHHEDAFQGIHAPAILVILDEAGGIPKSLWTAASTLITNDRARILAIGNPDHTGSEFDRVCGGADPAEGGMSTLGWNVIPIPVFAGPNFTGEQVPDTVAASLTSRGWAEDFAMQVGGPELAAAHHQLQAVINDGYSVDAALDQLPDDIAATLQGAPLYVSKVLGRFPEDTSDGVILWSWLNACRSPHPDPPAGPVELGIDVAGSDTGDETVIVERRGPTVARTWTVRSADPERVADRCLQAIDEAQPTAVKIDSIGVGWGLMGTLRSRRPWAHVVGVNVAEAASEPTRFANRRAELWWTVGRDLSLDRGWDLSAADEATLTELAAPSWWLNKRGCVVVEPKEAIVKRLGRSTDRADALLLAFYRAAARATAGVPARRVATGAELVARRNGQRVTR